MSKVKFRLSLNEEQKAAKACILQSDIAFLHGKTGSGKTILAVQIGLEGVIMNSYSKLIITRPTVSKEDLGFIPGSIAEKMAPWLAPIYSNLENLFLPDKVAKLETDKKIEIAPISFLRGRTFTNSVIVVDEYQNLDREQYKMVLGRLGKGSKIILCGDDEQIDLKHSKDSGIHLTNKLNQIEGVVVINLQTNHRHPILTPVLSALAD